MGRLCMDGFQVRTKYPLCLVVGVADVVANSRTLAANLTVPAHLENLPVLPIGNEAPV